MPKRLIAQKPVSPRDHSRLLVLDRGSGRISHHRFYDLVDLLKPGDILVLNNSKVFPARLIGQKEITGGKVEILLNRQIEPGLWEAIGSNLKIGNRIKFKNSKLKVAILDKSGQIYRIRMNMEGIRMDKEIEKIGVMPLPPYIKRKLKTKNLKLKTNDGDFDSDKKNYQTVYAKERGSVAAPTAGLHFTQGLLKKIKDKGVRIEYLTLHVGLGTFAPVKEEKIEQHKMHPEHFSVSQKVLEKIIETKRNHHRIIAVGTTTARTLETMFEKFQITNNKFQIPKPNQANEASEAKTYFGWTNLFIYPGYQFMCVDALITNFHLPKSTLLMLVSAFAGKKNIDHAYQTAIEQEYRFYSYGDAMLIT